MVRPSSLVAALSLHLVVPAQQESLVAEPAPAIAMEPMAASLGGRMEKDTLSWRSRHSPRKATLLSAVLPGAGQVYNRKYWKVPIVAAGLGVSYWFIQENRSQYNYYRDAYVAIIDGDPATVDPFDGQASAGAVLNVAETYRRWRDLSVVAFGLVYVLNVMDAAVDAHFVRFDVSEDLSLQVAPSLPLAAQGAFGVGLALTLR